MPFSLNNSPALIALATWWNNGAPTDRLDFSDCEPLDVQQLPNELIRFLATKITSISLPRRLDQSTLPGWLSELKSIRQLNVPDFVGEAIDLTPLNPRDGYTVEIGGRPLERIDVTDLATVSLDPMNMHRQIFVEESIDMRVDANASSDADTARVWNVFMQWIGNGIPEGTLDFDRCRASAVKQISPQTIRFFQPWITSLALPQRLTQQDVPDWLSELKTLKNIEISRCWELRVDLRHLRPDEPFILRIGDEVAGVKEVHASDKAVVLFNDNSLDGFAGTYKEGIFFPFRIDYAMPPDVRDALATWWGKGNLQEVLDFSNCDPAHLEKMGSAIDVLQEKITSIKLPRSLTQETLPTWLPKLGSLERLEIPSYEGQFINLTPLAPQAPFKLEIGGTKIRNAYVPELVDTYCREMTNDQQVRVHSYNATGDLTDVETAMGYSYFARIDGKLNWESLNGAGRFANTEIENSDVDSEELYSEDDLVSPDQKIVCRHMALWEIIGRQKNEEKDVPVPHRTNARAAEMGTKSLVEKIPPKIEKLFDELTHSAPLAYFVGQKQFGEVLAQELESMSSDGKGESKEMMLLTKTHAMSIHLRAKTLPDGRKRYAVTLYDPNVSHMHIRLVEDDLEAIRRLPIDSFVRKESFTTYFGKEHKQTKNSLLIPVPKDLHTCLESDKPIFSLEETQNRTLKECLSKADKVDPLRLEPSLDYGFSLPIDDIKKQIAAFEQYEDRIKFLKFELPKRGPIFNVAATNGNVVGTKDFGRLVIELASEKIINPKDVKDLLLAKDPSDDPFLFTAAERGHPGVIREYCQLLLEAGKKNLLSPEDFKELAISADRNGGSAIAAAASCNHASVVREIGQFFIEARKNNLLTQDDFKLMIAGKDDDNTPIIAAALQGDLKETAIQHGLVLLESAHNMLLDSKELVECLLAKDGDEKPTFNMELVQENLEMAKAHSRIILLAYADGFISETQLNKLNPEKDWIQNNLPLEHLIADIRRTLRQNNAVTISGPSNALSRIDSGIEMPENDAVTVSGPSNPLPRVDSGIEIPAHNTLDNLSSILSSVWFSAVSSQENKEAFKNSLQTISDAAKNISARHDARQRGEALHTIKREIDEIQRLIDPQSIQHTGTQERLSTERKSTSRVGSPR